MGITFGDYLIDSGYYDPTDESEEEMKEFPPDEIEDYLTESDVKDHPEWRVT